ncbi:unnamed protein product [marine sediment metagenome]|uniref:Uncharacterized protein n=1 Tax=marine sediment metagenome TaxID=412755 RepID=X1DMK5_9ZZZZ
MKLKIENKRGYLTRDFVVAGVILMGVIGLMILMVQGLAQNYGREDLIDESFKENYDKLENVTEPVTTLLAEVTSEEGLSFKGVFDVAFGAAFVAISLIFGTITLFSNVFKNVLIDFGIPSAVANILFIVGFVTITATLIFVWLSSISRGKI